MKGKMSAYMSLLGTALLFSTFLTMLMTFLVAYFSPSKSTIVYINMFNEADAELILLSLITILGSFSFLKGIRDIRA